MYYGPVAELLIIIIRMQEASNDVNNLGKEAIFFEEILNMCDLKSSQPRLLPKTLLFFSTSSLKRWLRLNWASFSSFELLP